MTLHLSDTEFLCNTQHWVLAEVEMKAEFRLKRGVPGSNDQWEILEMTDNE